MKNKKLIILGGALIGFSIISYFIFKNMFKSDNNSEDLKDVDIEEGNTTEKKSELIFSKPVTDFKYPLIYVFGGINYANPDWMLKQIPKEILSRAFFVFSPYTKSFGNIKRETEKYLSANKIEINPKKISIIGFSRGGLNVQDAYDKSFRVVGLIDPSTNSKYLDLDLSDNVIISHNSDNWGGYPNIKSNLPKIEKLVKEKGGIGEKVDLGHSKIPTYFFEKFKSKFI